MYDIRMKYLPELADDSEIRKNRELIEDLRANLRKSTLDSIKKLSQKGRDSDPEMRELDFNFLNDQVANTKRQNSSIGNSERTLVYSQSDGASVRFVPKTLNKKSMHE